MSGSGHEALHWEPDRDERVHCTLCPQDCRIPHDANPAGALRIDQPPGQNVS